jgi:hypothetical protein
MTFDDAFAPGAHLSESFEALKRRPASLIVGAVLVGLADGGPNALLRGTGEFAQVADNDASAAIAAVLVLAALVLSLVAWLVTCWLTPGWLRVQAQALDPDASEDVSVLFSGADCFGRMLGWTTLRGTIVLALVLVALLFGVVAGGAVLLATGAAMTDMEGGGLAALLTGLGVSLVVGLPATVYVSLGMALGTHALVFEGLGPMDALSRSWDLVAGNRIRLMIFNFVLGLVGTLGFLLCCVGAIPAGAVVQTATTRGWLLLTQGAAAKV